MSSDIIQTEAEVWKRNIGTRKGRRTRILRDRSHEHTWSSYTRMLPVSAAFLNMATVPLQDKGVPQLGFYSNYKGQRSVLSRGCHHYNIHLYDRSGYRRQDFLSCSKLFIDSVSFKEGNSYSTHLYFFSTSLNVPPIWTTCTLQTPSFRVCLSQTFIHWT
jgi:hypothetical protein